MNTNALRQKILDLAIHGKLVKQDPSDESATILLEKIRAEKEKKIASGELKRGKNDSYIFFGDDNRHYEKFADGRVKDIEDEIPFAVPEGWAWCRLGEICEFISRGKTPVYTKESQYPVLAQKCNQWDGIRLDKVLFLDPNSLSKWTNEYHLQHEDIVINSTGTGTIGRVGIFDIGILGQYPFIVPDSHISVVRCYKVYIHRKYIYHIFTSEYLQTKINKVATGSTNQKELPKKVLTEFFIPIPPLSEQQRIVAKIEAIFAQIDLLEQNKADLQTAVKQAKSKILDLAIRGKLVPQDPADEPASVMLEKLHAEKEAKIAAGEIKRGKNDSYIYKNSTDNCYY
ncbi:MAG TPA: restriction endonuclease subunit S, partial [Treponema sp.]